MINHLWIRNRLQYARSKFFLSGTPHLIVNDMNNIQAILHILDEILSELPEEIVDLETKDVIK